MDEDWGQPFLRKRQTLYIAYTSGECFLTNTILLYIATPELLTPKEKSKLIDMLKSVWDEHNNKLVQERLDSIIRGDEYV